MQITFNINPALELKLLHRIEHFFQSRRAVLHEQETGLFLCVDDLRRHAALAHRLC